MRRIFCLLFCAASLPGLFALNLCDKKIVVKSSNGSTEYVVSDIRSMKFNNGDVFINMNDGSVASWPANEINVMSFIYFEPSPETGIKKAESSPFTISSGVLRVESSLFVPVTLSTVDGKRLFKGYCCGELLLPLSLYPAGVYLLDINGTIYKIINR